MVRAGPALGLAGQVALLALLGVGAAGWAVGLCWAVLVAAFLDRGLARLGRRALGPADRVTLVRAVLTGGVAALVADAFSAQLRVVAVVALCVIALVLDAVDGPVARITATASPLGARFDMEVDAFLILALSVEAARDFGGWVLLIGAARYVLWLAERAVGWLRIAVAPRYWRKTVAAIQGITLTVAVAGVLPEMVIAALLAVALLLLAESFGQVVWLQRHAHRGTPAEPRRLWLGSAVNGVAFAVAWFALVAPDNLGELTPTAFVRIPVEGLGVAAITALVPGPARTADSVGHAWTTVVVAVALALAVAIVVCGTRAVGRLRVAQR
ncbi:MAG TPA: CDP-alcohol phosphatidyltransferase family protein [Jatrophihabitans sp.]